MARSPRLTKNLKDAIVHRALKKAFQNRQADINAQRRRLAEDVVDDMLGEHKKAFDAMPDHLKPMTPDFDINIGGERATLSFNGNRTTYQSGDHSDLARQAGQVYRGVPACLVRYWHPDQSKKKAYDGKHPFTDRWRRLCADQDLLSEEIQHLKGSIFGVLGKCNTVKQLIEVWPEADELLDDDEKLPLETAKTLPAVVIGDLNATIGLPSGEKVAA